jgi:predicted sugar kinase
MTRAAWPAWGVEGGFTGVGVTVRVAGGVAVTGGEITGRVGTQLARIKQASMPPARRDENRRIFMELALISKWFFSVCIIIDIHRHFQKTNLKNEFTYQ